MLPILDGSASSTARGSCTGTSNPPEHLSDLRPTADPAGFRSAAPLAMGEKSRSLSVIPDARFLPRTNSTTGEASRGRTDIYVARPRSTTWSPRQAPPDALERWRHAGAAGQDPARPIVPFLPGHPSGAGHRTGRPPPIRRRIPGAVADVRCLRRRHRSHLSDPCPHPGAQRGRRHGESSVTSHRAATSGSTCRSWVPWGWCRGHAAGRRGFIGYWMSRPAPLTPNGQPHPPLHLSPRRPCRTADCVVGSRRPPTPLRHRRRPPPRYPRHHPVATRAVGTPEASARPPSPAAAPPAAPPNAIIAAACRGCGCRNRFADGGSSAFGENPCASANRNCGPGC